MAEKNNQNSLSGNQQIVAEARQYREQRENSYREKALKMYPWVCGRCSREFSRSNLRELTVHHKNHDHDDNPEDGSNWELLCLYCHDNEHSRYIEQVRYAGSTTPEKDAEATFRPFSGLKNLFKD